MVRTSERRVNGGGKYVRELRAATPGYLHGAVMKEVRRPEGLYNVQIVEEPKAPEGILWRKSWIEDYISRTIPTAEVRSDIGCAVQDSAKYLVFLEKASGVGFRTHGLYERVFVKQVEAVEDEMTVRDVEIIENPTKEEMTPQAMRYRNMYTMEICGATHYLAVSKAKMGGKVWYLEEKEVAEVQFLLRMEAYKIDMSHYNGWCNQYGLMVNEVSGNEVRKLCMCMIK